DILGVNSFNLALPNFDFFAKNGQFFYWISLMPNVNKLLTQSTKFVYILCAFFGWKNMAEVFRKQMLGGNAFNFYILPLVACIPDVRRIVLTKCQNINSFEQFIASMNVVEQDRGEITANQQLNEEEFLLFLFKALVKDHDIKKPFLLCHTW